MYVVEAADAFEIRGRLDEDPWVRDSLLKAEYARGLPLGLAPGASCGSGGARSYVTSAEPVVMRAALSEVSSTTFPSGSSTMEA